MGFNLERKHRNMFTSLQPLSYQSQQLREMGEESPKDTRGENLVGIS